MEERIKMSVNAWVRGIIVKFGGERKTKTAKTDTDNKKNNEKP